MEFIILTGEKQCGKTTFLQKYIQQKGVDGVLSPIIDGERVFVSRNKQLAYMERPKDKNDELPIGRFVFSKSAFRSAVDFLLDCWDNEEIHSLIIDELGPLELQNKGFWGLIQSIKRNPKSKRLILVVRTGLVQDMIEKFGIEKVQLIEYHERERLLVEQ